MVMRKRILLLGLMFVLVTAGGADASYSRIKDMAVLEGQSTEPLLGYGLVVGLNGTGDGQSSAYTVNSLTSMLERLGVTVDPAMVKLKNVAAVLITSELPPASAPGSRVDVKVSSLGDASSLEGGELIMAPMKGTDGNVYVVAQGAVSIGGFNISGGANNSIRKNHSTVGRIPNGGKVTSRGQGSMVRDGVMAWLLHNPDFTTAQRVTNAINKVFGGGTAKALDAQRIEVAVPQAFHGQPVDFIARMGELPAEADQTARVIINERTGTIVAGDGVRIHEAAVAHGNLKVVIKTSYDVSQPNSFNESGRTVVTPAVLADVQESDASVIHVPDTGTVSDIVAVLNEVGASPRDIVAILQALKVAGALQAELVIM
jgi:flagellar P-ring protein precursor FlgI